MDKFEEKVLLGLKSCGIEIENISKENPLGAAVSGGADSVSLLVSLSGILEETGKKNCLKIITVNHGIREKSETDGDAAYVESLCGNLGVKCETVVFASGKVACESKKRGKGLEEAAREMRYNVFEKFIKSENLAFLCLAHNQNDRIETVLMRFLKGSGSEGLGGIPQVRGKIARPLLEVSRDEIESYLSEKKIGWRTDSTNFENQYARNKIRNVLVPFLDENFSGWKNSVLLAAKKASDDNFFIQKKADEILKKNLTKGKNLAEIERTAFFSVEPALRRRIVYNVLNKIGFGERFPFKLVEKICLWEKDKDNSLGFGNLKILLTDEKIIFKNQDAAEKKEAVSSGYNFIFTGKNDFFEFDNLKYYIEENDKKTFLCVERAPGKKDEGRSDLFSSPEKKSLEISLPFFVGSAAPGEKIRAADGKFKKISDIFSGWKVAENKRNLIPVVRKIQGGIEAVLILGNFFGFPEWKVSVQSKI